MADAGRASAAQRWTIALLRRGKAAAHRRARDFDAALGELGAALRVFPRYKRALHAKAGRRRGDTPRPFTL